MEQVGHNLVASCTYVWHVGTLYASCHFVFLAITMSKYITPFVVEA